MALPFIFDRHLYSAASCAVPLVYGSTQLYAKDASGKIIPWNPSGEFADIITTEYLSTISND